MTKLTATSLTLEMMSKLVVNPKIAHLFLLGHSDLALKILHTENGGMVSLTQTEMAVMNSGGWMCVNLKDAYDANGNRLPGFQVNYES